MSSETNHKGDTRIYFSKFKFTNVNPTSPLRNSLGLSLLQLDPLSWVFFQPLPPFHYLDPFHQWGKITPTQTCRYSPQRWVLAGGT